MRLFSITTSVVLALATSSAFAQNGKLKGKRTAAAAKPATAEAPRLIAQAVQPTPAAASSEIRRGLRFEAFVEPQARLTNEDLETQERDKGFTVNDAALYVSKDFGQGISGMVDLAFEGSYGGGSQAFAFANTKSQAFLQLESTSLTTKFGQFDTLFGLEANDSRDRFFADPGFIKGYLLPITHVGATVGFNVQQLTLRGLVSNPSLPPTGPSGSMADQNPEFGGQVRFDAGQGYGAFGFLLNEAKNGDNKSNQLIDIIGGFKFDQLTLEGSFDFKKTAGYDKSATAFGVLASFGLSNELALGGRIEYLKDGRIFINGAARNIESAFTVATGVNYKFLDDVTLRGDVTFGNVKPAANQGLKDTSPFGVSFSVLASL